MNKMFNATYLHKYERNMTIPRYNKFSQDEHLTKIQSESQKAKTLEKVNYLVVIICIYSQYT
jgi:hypothetical protein